MSIPCVLVTTTISKSPNELRFRLAQETVKRSGESGYPIIVVDGSPDRQIQGILAAAGAFVFQEAQPGMGASRRQAIRAGLNFRGGTADIIVWLEPEKHPVVPLLEPLMHAVASGQYDLVIPKRTLLDSYPAYQAASEHLANQALGAITGRPDLDLYFGPRVMSRKVASQYFQTYDGRFGDNWESIFVPVLVALAAGVSVGSMSVNYAHPAEQTAAETSPEIDRKRDRQRIDIIGAMSRAAQAMGFYPRLQE